MPAASLAGLIDLALAEDVGSGDVTTEAIVPADVSGTAEIVVREPGVVCGLEVALEVVRRLDPAASMEVLVPDGEAIHDPPEVAARLTGSLAALLTAERTLLNLVQRMSGIATATRRYAEAIEGTGVALLDTRKTAPGMRALDKYAVACGGGCNHRAGLFDAVLIKDNHVAAAGGIAAAIRAVRARHPQLPVEVRSTRSSSSSRRWARRRTRSCSTTWRSRPFARPSAAPPGGPGWRPPVVSPCRPSVTSPRPASMQSRWARSHTRYGRSTSPWR